MKIYPCPDCGCPVEATRPKRCDACSRSRRTTQERERRRRDRDAIATRQVAAAVLRAGGRVCTTCGEVMPNPDEACGFCAEEDRLGIIYCRDCPREIPGTRRGRQRRRCDECKAEAKRAQDRDSYERHRDRILADRRATYAADKDELAKKRREDYDPRYERLRRLNDVEQVREREKRSYKRNKKRILAQRRAYYEANRDKILAARRTYRQANKDQISARQRAYYAANKDEIAAKRMERERRICAPCGEQMRRPSEAQMCGFCEEEIAA